MRLFSKVWPFLMLVTLSAPANAAQQYESLLMPMNCSELLPDNSPFVGYFDAVAGGQVVKDRSFSMRIYQLISLYEKLNLKGEYSPEKNPVGILIRQTTCFFRQQRKPTQVIPFDDTDFLKFLKSSLGELEAKVEEAIFRLEFEKKQTEALERQLRGNSAMVDRIKRQAEAQAVREYRKISERAKKKVDAQ